MKGTMTSLALSHITLSGGSLPCQESRPQGEELRSSANEEQGSELPVNSHVSELT